VHLQYGDDVLHRLAVDVAFQPAQWELNIVKCYRRRHQSLVAAKDREDLRRVMSLDLRTENSRAGERFSIRLVDRSRLLLDFDVAKTDKVTVVGIVESDTQEVAS
jgi:plasmid maintenance system killer protein